MNKKMRDLLEQINNKKVAAKTLLDEKKLDEAKSLTEDIKNLQKEFDIEAALYEEKKEDFEDVSAKANKGDAVKAFYKALRGENLTEVENALITGGTNGENLIVPQDIQTQINELRREYKSARPYVGAYNTSTLTGSFVYEDITTLTELTNFTDGADVPASNDPKFTTTSYAVKEYGGILPVSNVLLQNENGGLMAYLGRWFNKKAVRTENSKIFAELKNGKTAKALADWKALKSSINKDLDPLIAMDTVIITNQDGFDFMDSALDGQGRPVLQPDPTNPTRKQFMGYPVEVFSNAELPTTGTTTKKAPVFYGNTRAGVTFVDRNVYEVVASKEAGFKQNQTLIRIIEMFDVIGADKNAYQFGEFTLPGA
ncbi:phage major capsid protein [Brevibacillus choshinensis]|uniref:phage major capsid protein n=1 Tax=Brevibacillus choshinensis TaxID=54911 RepID=UPI002E205E51|nr:phage major capsid protein [Brevibacillus choshinensis]MED4586666.1 phage major capsid protein [Brevibacillus choshinensis]